MKGLEFQNLLLKSAVYVIACDGVIEEVEISSIKSMAENEIYFLGYDLDSNLNEFVEHVKMAGKSAINEFIVELSCADLNKSQEIMLVDVILRAIDSDQKIDFNEVVFLQLVKSKLKVSEDELLSNFPNQIGHLLGSNGYNELKDFGVDIIVGD